MSKVLKGMRELPVQIPVQILKEERSREIVPVQGMSRPGKVKQHRGSQYTQRAMIGQESSRT